MKDYAKVSQPKQRSSSTPSLSLRLMVSLALIAISLGAGLLYISHPSQHQHPVQQTPVALQQTRTTLLKQHAEQQAKTATHPAPQPADTEFSFYAALPNHSPLLTDTEPKALQIEDPHAYAIQVGVFDAPAPANRQQERLGLLGFNAHIIQRHTSKHAHTKRNASPPWVYKVWVGPYAQVTQAQSEQQRLRAHRISTLLLLGGKPVKHNGLPSPKA